ncbi:MAG: penicillin-binding protein [Candidatus Liptonbacteria bacterium]|nr:penicillin-binding protein [Candidatus Liptonbacteria bacterium]
MGFFRRSSSAKELLGEWFLSVADKSGFRLIRKRPRLLKAFKLITGVFAGAFLIVALSALGGYAVLRFYTGYIPYLGDLNDSHGKPLDWSKFNRPDYKKLSSRVDDKNGEPIWRYFDEVRDPVKIGEVPPLFIKGYVAAEDQRFYSHSGVDPWAFGRASSIQLLYRIGWHYGQKSGASTITQQAARICFADEEDSFATLESSLSRKVKEARVAFQLEKRYSKDRIMEILLNCAYFGHGANGLKEARRFYFGKSIGETPSPEEVAILVALNKSPVKYCPIFHEPEKPERKPGMSEEAFLALEARYKEKFLEEGHRIAVARDRYNYVLRRTMEDEAISRYDYEASLFTKDDPPQLGILHITPFKNLKFGHAATMTKAFLLAQGFKDDDITSRMGLRIGTTIDPAIQITVSEEVERQYQELNREVTTKEKIEGSAIVIENETGNIVALVGGHNFGESQFNRVFSLRSPGSLFKVFTLAAAIERFGMDLDTKVCNCPFSLPDKIDIHGRVIKRWVPQNFEEKNPVRKGFIDLAVVGIRSVNLGALDIARRIGIRSVIEVANSMGVRGYKNEFADSDGEVWFKKPREKYDRRGLELYLPTAIGGSGASLLELAGAFSVFARGGTYIRPTLIQEVRDVDGKLLYKAPEPEGKRVLSEETSAKMTMIMRAVTKIGTAQRSMRGIEQQVACKTGTSNGPDDLSIACYTPEYTIVTRWGYDAPKPIVVPEYMKRISGDAETQVSGGWVAGFAERRMWDRIYQNRIKVEFPQEVEEGWKSRLAGSGN